MYSVTEEAEIVIDHIENKVEKSVGQTIKLLAKKENVGKLNQELTITKSDLKTEIAATKAELKTEIAATKTELKVEMATVKSKLLRAVYVVGLVLFLAIVGSEIAIINFPAK